jgi:hypothetical protein
MHQHVLIRAKRDSGIDFNKLVASFHQHRVCLHRTTLVPEENREGNGKQDDAKKSACKR